MDRQVWGWAGNKETWLLILQHILWEGEESFFKVKIIVNPSTSFLEAIYKFMKIRYVVIKTFPQDLLLSPTGGFR